jgi:uroporphyrinogen III methyltransferase/synthase
VLQRSITSSISRSPLPEGIKIASIGPITSAAIKEHGLTVDVEAKENSIPGLVAAVEKFWR